MAEKLKFCRSCGKQINTDVPFCRFCGFRFDAPAQPSAVKQADERAAAPLQRSIQDKMKASLDAGRQKDDLAQPAVSSGAEASPSQQPAAATRYCRQCGNAVPATARFCGKCGFRFDAGAAQAQSAQQASAFSREKNRRGGLKDSPIGAAARQNVRRAMPGGAQVKKRSKGVIAAVLAFAILLTGLGWPGWIRHLFDQPDTPPSGYYGGNTTSGNSTGGNTTGGVPAAIQSLSSPLDAGYLDGVGEGVGDESTFVEMPVVSQQTLAVPEDGAAVVADCGAVVEFGEFNADAVEQVTVTEHAPDTQTIPGGSRVCYSIDAGDVHQFDYFFDITLPYDPARTESGNEAGSVFAEYHNEETGEWEPVLYDVDTANHRLIIHTNHLSDFAAATVQSSKLVYTQLAKIGSVYVSDEEAMKDLKTHMGELSAEYKEDPIAVALFYQMVFNTVDFASFGSISESEIRQAVNEAYGQQDGVFNDIVSWITSFAYDVGSYAELIPPSTVEWANASVPYLPGQLFELGANFATFLSAASLAESVYDEMERSGDVSTETVMNIYKWVNGVNYSLALSKLGVSFGSLYALPVIAVDYSISKIREVVQDAEDDAMAKALYYYYQQYYNRPLYRDEHKVSDISGASMGIAKESWMNRLMKIYQNNIKRHGGDPKYLASGINSAITYDIAQAYTGLSAEAMGEGDLAIAMGGGIPDNERRNVWSTWETLDPNRREQVSGKAEALLLRDLEPVLKEVAKQQRLSLRQNATACGGQVSKALNTKHTLIIEEKIPEGRESQFAGCKVVFTHHKRTVVDAMTNPYNKDPRIVEWKGVLDEEGGMVVSFNTFGYIKAGVPDKVQIFAPNDDVERSTPIAEVDFEIRDKTTKIVLGDLPFTWFEGLWKWEDRHDADSPFDDEAFELSVLAADATHACFRQVDVWGDGAVNLCEAEYDVFEDRLILRDVGTGAVMLVMTASGKEPDRVTVSGLKADDEIVMERAQESDAYWNDRRLERDQLVQMAVEQGYMTKTQGG